MYPGLSEQHIRQNTSNTKQLYQTMWKQGIGTWCVIINTNSQ